MKINIGQPISHRLDHMMSGIRAQIAVKLFGPDIEELRDRARDIAEMMVGIPGSAAESTSIAMLTKTESSGDLPHR